MKKISISLVVGIFLIGGFIYYAQRNSYSHIPNASVSKADTTPVVVAQDLHVPWTIDFLPTGEMLVTERDGVLQVIGTTTLKIDVPGVFESGEGGLMGLALHPDFSANRFLYLYFTYKAQGKTLNKVVRYVFDGKTLKENKIIIERRVKPVTNLLLKTKFL